MFLLCYTVVVHSHCLMNAALWPRRSGSQLTGFPLYLRLHSIFLYVPQHDPTQTYSLKNTFPFLGGDWVTTSDTTADLKVCCHNCLSLTLLCSISKIHIIVWYHVSALLSSSPLFFCYIHLCVCRQGITTLKPLKRDVQSLVYFKHRSCRLTLQHFSAFKLWELLKCKTNWVKLNFDFRIPAPSFLKFTDCAFSPPPLALWLFDF